MLYFAVIFLAIFSIDPVYAQFAGDFGKPGQQDIRLSYKHFFDTFPSSGVNRVNQKSEQIDASMFVPVYQSENSTYAISGKYQHLDFGNLLADSNFVPVEELYSHQYGFAWSHQEANESSWSLTGTFGSASNKPFEGSDVSSLDVTMIRKFTPKTDGSFWTLYVNYSNNRAFLSNVPIPGFSYIFMNQKKTRGGALGIPIVSYWWRPTKKLSMSVFAIVPARAQTQIGYMVWGSIQANLKFEFGQQTYFRSGRSDKREQLFYETSKLAASLKTFLGRATFFEIELLRLFNRSLYDGNSVFDLTSERMNLPHEWQVMTSLQLSF